MAIISAPILCLDERVVGYYPKVYSSPFIGDLCVSPIGSYADEMNRRKKVHRNLAKEFNAAAATREELEKEFRAMADREEAAYRQNFHQQQTKTDPWHLLPPEIKEYIIHLWENQQVYDHLYHQHSCEPILYKGPVELKKAWKLGKVYKTDCGCYYSASYEEGSYPGTCKYAIRYLGAQATQEELDEGRTHLSDALEYIPSLHRCIVTPFSVEDKEKIWPHWRSTAKNPAKRS